MALQELAVRAATLLGGGGVRFARAPGRVNLIGDHTDYNAGFALPMAIDREVVLAYRRTDNGRVRIRSTGHEGAIEVRADGEPVADEPPPAWGAAGAVVVRALSLRGRAPIGMDAAIASELPSGSGLGSSAAVEVAVGVGLCDTAGFELSPRALALATQEAETVGTGVPCGVLDQLASLAGVAGAALLLDCRTLEVEPVPIPGDLAVLAVHSGVERRLAEAGYAERRAECEELARQLGADSLREVNATQAAPHPRARHVVSENARVLAVVDALRSGDRTELARAFAASHASLRDDFEVSTPELDTLVRALLDAGAIGARLTGAGFGGSVVAIADDERAYRVADLATARYRAETGRNATAFRCRAVAGAGPFDPLRP